ncbi:copper resistance CopC family protein [Herbiconiux sp. L3-i23]|uniref:copper resistance CopC family protein n=1 Tax=Herbiconiux sp. L3-i23 TaxID=2905871 RepID=UPI002065CB67|nr:copper resistance CopC family protein [Herbiconiux sp. L3-i23]BDI23514.1 hypothetical protein L3i23_22900 [Herbiconiux sp. L3-i23]
MQATTRRAGVLGVLSGGALAVLLALAPAGAASAHDSLESATPADGETVVELSSVELSYSGTLLSIGEDQRSAAIQVTRDGRYFEAGCPTLVDNTASVDVALGEAGQYEVVWQVVSSDGHTISDSYEFTYDPLDGTDVAEGADAPACGEASSDTDGPSDDAILIGAAVGIGALAVVGVVLAIVFGRRRGDFGRPAADNDSDTK